MRITTTVFVVDCEQDTAPVLVASLNKNTREAVDPPFEEVEDDIKSREVKYYSPSKKSSRPLDSFSLPPVPSSAFLAQGKKIGETRIKLF